jgi:hypothetical protein
LSSPSALWRRKSTVIAGLSLAAVVLHLVLRFGFHTAPGTSGLSLVALILGGLPMLYPKTERRQNSDVTAEAAGVVVMDMPLKRWTSFMHISRRLRIIALQSARWVAWPSA